MATYELSGTWVFNDEVTVSPDNVIKYYCNFTSNGTSFISIRLNTQAMYFWVDDNADNSVEVYRNTNAEPWVNSSYKTIDFGANAQTVSKEFYEWFIANAKPMVTDLVGYTITVPAGWNGSILDDLFYDVSGTINGQSFIYIEGAGADYINFLPMPDEDYLVMTPSSSFVVSFTGGTETDSEYLIQFFVQNNATFENTGEETQTLTVVNSNNPIETVTFTMPKGYTFEQFIGSAYDTSGGKFVISNKYTVEYESNKLLQEDTDNAYDITVASGTFYYKGEAAQSGIWYNGSLLATIKEGQTITLHTNGKKAKTDIVVRASNLQTIIVVCLYESGTTITKTIFLGAEIKTWQEFINSYYNSPEFNSQCGFYALLEEWSKAEVAIKTPWEAGPSGGLYYDESLLEGTLLTDEIITSGVYYTYLSTHGSGSN